MRPDVFLLRLQNYFCNTTKMSLFPFCCFDIYINGGCHGSNRSCLCHTPRQGEEVNLTYQCPWWGCKSINFINLDLCAHTFQYSVGWESHWALHCTLKYSVSLKVLGCWATGWGTIVSWKGNWQMRWLLGLQYFEHFSKMNAVIVLFQGKQLSYLLSRIEVECSSEN